MCVTKSIQSVGKLIFGVGVVIDEGMAKVNVKMVSATLTLTSKMRSKCGCHEISNDHISGISKRRINTFSAPCTGQPL